MAKLPRDLSGDRAVRAFTRAGFDIDHQTGSHIIMVRSSDPRKPLSVPRHRSLKPGLLAKLIKDAGLTVEEFIELI